MNTYQTPYKQKKFQFCNSKRQFHLQSMRKSVREQVIKTQKKKQQNKCLHKIILRLDIDCGDVGAVAALKSMHFQEGFYINQDNCIRLLPIIKELSKNNQKHSLHSKQSDCQINEDKYEKSVNNLHEILYILCHNAKYYPQYGCFDDEQIIETLLKMMESSVNQRISIINVKLINLLILNDQNKKAIIQKKIFVILANKQFKNMLTFIEILFSNLFKSQKLQLTDEDIADISKLFKEHHNLFQVQQQLERFYYFAKGFTDVVPKDVANSVCFFELALKLLQKVDEVSITLKKNHILYSQIVEILLNKIDFVNSFRLHQSQILFKIFSSVWNFHWSSQQQHSSNPIEFTPDSPQQAKQRKINHMQIQQIVRSFSSILNFIQSKFTVKSAIGNKMENFKQTFYSHLFKNQIHDIQANISLINFFMKFYYVFQDRDIPYIIQLFKNNIHNKQTRILCLKIMVRAKRQGKLDSQEYFNLSVIYNNFVEQKQKDQLSGYMLNTLPPPTQEQIMEFQQEIKSYEMEKTQSLNKVHIQETKQFQLLHKQETKTQNMAIKAFLSKRKDKNDIVI